jgi:hypothetical protein
VKLFWPRRRWANVFTLRHSVTGGVVHQFTATGRYWTRAGAEKAAARHMARYDRSELLAKLVTVTPYPMGRFDLPEYRAGIDKRIDGVR